MLVLSSPHPLGKFNVAWLVMNRFEVQPHPTVMELTEDAGVAGPREALGGKAILPSKSIQRRDK